MLKKSFSVYDFMVEGIKLTLGNIRLVFLTTITFIATSFFAIGSLFLIALPMFKSVWKIVADHRAVASGCIDRSLCKLTMHNMWKEIGLVFSSNVLFSVFIILLSTVVLSGLMLGLDRIALDICENGKSSVSRLFSCFHLVPKFLVSFFLIMLAVIVGLFLFIVPGIILIIRLRFFSYYIVDKNSGIFESIKKSYNATRGLTWDILGLSVLEVAFTRIGSVFFVPTSLLMMTVAYRKLPKV